MSCSKLSCGDKEKIKNKSAENQVYPIKSPDLRSRQADLLKEIKSRISKNLQVGRREAIESPEDSGKPHRGFPQTYSFGDVIHATPMTSEPKCVLSKT